MDYKTAKLILSLPNNFDEKILKKQYRLLDKRQNKSTLAKKIHTRLEPAGSR